MTSFTVTGPQFDRVDSKVIFSRPTTTEEFISLKSMAKADLVSLGCGVWNETSEHYHMLYPKEWYATIPSGLEIVLIDDEVQLFEPGVTDDDTRFGLLAYGFLVAKDV